MIHGHKNDTKIVNLFDKFTVLSNRLVKWERLFRNCLADMAGLARQQFNY